MSMEALLARFVKPQSTASATATVATPATVRRRNRVTVAKVATVAVADLSESVSAVAKVANVAVANHPGEKPALTTANDGHRDADQLRWPHAAAWSSAEVALYGRRVALLNQRGLSMDHAEELAERLLERDRDGDDRRMPIECAHYCNGRCTNPAADLHGALGELATMLQRCPGFQDALEQEGAHD